MTAPSKPMTWTRIKKHIQNADQAALLDLIQQMYKANDFNKAFLAIRFQSEATLDSKELKTLKKRIDRLMCPNLSSYNAYSADPQPREAKKLITDYKKTGDILGTLDLMLTFLEAGTEFADTYGDDSFYSSLCAMMTAFAKLFRQSPDEYRPYFEDRLLALADEASGIGWGYGDHVTDTVDELCAV